MKSSPIMTDRPGMDSLADVVKSLLADTQGLPAEGIMSKVHSRFGDKMALASSFSLEDQVLLDMLCKVAPDIRVLTLDTGRLPKETFEVMEQSRRRYGIRIEVWFPEAESVERMVNEHGPNLFYKSVELRRLCCQVRKMEPLRRALAGVEAWICGLRAGQSQTRDTLRRIDADGQFGRIKVCPLADWSTEQVWDYICRNQVPYNRLHDEGYASIGCAPCTRAIGPGDDIRAGRWWWEAPELKECGLHIRPNGTLGPREVNE